MAEITAAERQLEGALLRRVVIEPRRPFHAEPPPGVQVSLSLAGRNPGEWTSPHVVHPPLVFNAVGPIIPVGGAVQCRGEIE